MVLETAILNVRAGRGAAFEDAEGFHHAIAFRGWQAGKDEISRSPPAE